MLLCMDLASLWHWPNEMFQVYQISRFSSQCVPRDGGGPFWAPNQWWCRLKRKRRSSKLAQAQRRSCSNRLTTSFLDIANRPMPLAVHHEALVTIHQLHSFSISHQPNLVTRC